MNRCTEAIVDIHGIKWYYPEICVDGGVFRAKNTYTNLTFPSGSFKHTISGVAYYDPIPYSGHFYGIRKYSGLAPNLPYIVNITGKSGSSAAIEIPTEIIEVEYNKNEDDTISNDYSGYRINYNTIPSGEFGRSVASKEDLLAIGCPKISVTSGNITYEDAGVVFLYRRNPRPTTVDWPLENYKSSWVLEKALTLPSGLISDYYTEENITIDGLPSNFVGIQKSWYVGQDGRQFGHSVDLSVNNDIKSAGEDKQEILVVGGVGAQWNRTFDDDPPSLVSIGLILFTDEFNSITRSSVKPYNLLTYQDIISNIFGKDKVFNYFSDPKTKFDVKIMICLVTANADEPDPDFPDKPSFVTIRRISKNVGFPVSDEVISNTLSGIKSSFLEAFPYTNELNSGIPPILGLCFDNSFGTGGRKALEPAIDRFIDFYKEYSFASGLKDFYDVRSSGSIVEYTVNQDINWIQMSNLALDNILDTGNLVENNQIRFFARDVGTFNGNDKNFNIPPASGGSVYIFEKESGVWNLIQEIKSPNITREYHDRFGHAVSISDNGEVIAIGSPYINQAVTIYERDYEERDRLYNNELLNWIENKYPEKYARQLADYYSKPILSLEDKKALYLSLDQEDKFKVRLENNIQEYQLIHTFDYSNMQPVGSWTFIPNEFAPTSRLGYSVDVNEDGSVVVAGAPSDSLNLYNDADVYYSFDGSYEGKQYFASYNDPDPSGYIAGRIKSGWSSSLYAGSAHVFESRKYYPHNKVIEYGVFGNLHEIISDSTADSGHFMYLSGIFSDKNFEKLPFSQPSIPQDAGLMFIITPKIDSLSDEVLNNIQNWLALGDRNLVLVGNDPRWEAGGIYGKSNDILNKLLSKLKSRMRIVPARNEYESLPSGYSSFNNIVPSYVPMGSTSTYVKRLPTRGSGVADIKISYPYNEEMPCELVTLCDPEMDPVQIQTRCEMPLRDYGDLRAEWNDYCCKTTKDGLVPVMYKKNWPFVFGSYTPDCDQVFEEKSTKNQEPIPLLVAAEKINGEIIYPAIPAKSGEKILYQTVAAGSINYYEFGSPIGNESNFSYSTDSIEDEDYNYIEYNITGQTNTELFYKPSDELGGILQAKGVPKVDIIPYLQKEEISDKGYFALEYEFKNETSSKINIIPSVQIESELKRGSNDENILFYQNLVSSSKTIFGRSNIAQLNWNGRKSFVDGYSQSLLKDALYAYNNVTLDVSTLVNEYNVAWLPNINSQLSQENLNNLIRWLLLGNKRLVITCDNTLSSINEAQQLCQKLDITLELLSQYGGSSINYPLETLIINPNHQIGGQFFTNDYKPLTYFSTRIGSFYPFKLNAGAIPLAYTETPIYDDVPKNYTNKDWDINAGIVQINMPVLPGSGYRLLITTESQDPTELYELSVNVDNASFVPSNPYPDFNSSFIYELNTSRVPYVSKIITSNVMTINCNGSCFSDFQVGDTDNINVYVSCVKPRVQSDFAPKSVRLVGISGVLIPIYEKAIVSTTQVPVGIEYYRISDPIDEYREVIDVIRTISTDNTKYCTTQCKSLGNQLIEDGPVVAAQEVEIFSPFDAGFARSRITIITDSSIVQGRYVLNEDNTVPRDTYEFIRSLYPETTFFSPTYGRQFNVYNKLISPERGSPSKYHRQAPYLALNKNFGNFGNSPTSPINPNESKYLFENVLRPELPWAEETDEKEISKIRNFFVSGFLSHQIQHAATSRISGVIDGISYYDAPITGGIPKILQDEGYDYLDFDKFPSGYPGDLFGYSVCARGEKILIGSPFSAFRTENITPWSSGTFFHLGQDGGAGSVYMFDKSQNNKWSIVKKFKPESLMGQLSGINTYSDQFGHSISMHNDVIIIGAPNHSYSNLYEDIYTNGAFARKNFNPQFDIPARNIYDLGYSGIRDSLEINDAYQKNIGAIYLYENKISDWENKKQSWKLIEKVVSMHENSEDERFGRNTYLNKSYRSDSDYCIVAGCNFASGVVDNVGVVYVKDIMLKSQKPSLPSASSWISAHVFGSRDLQRNPTVSLNFLNSGDSISYYASGVVVTTQKGEIFLEVSGQDPSTRGFISHRPYIQSIYGQYQYGQLTENNMILHVSGGYVPPSSQMPLIIDVENSSYVYNTLGLYSEVKSGDISTYPSGLNLFAQVPSGSSAEYLNLYSSGIGSPSDILNLSVRGK